jgi:hypothetical protein
MIDQRQHVRVGVASEHRRERRGRRSARERLAKLRCVARAAAHPLDPELCLHVRQEPVTREARDAVDHAMGR